MSGWEREGEKETMSVWEGASGASGWEGEVEKETMGVWEGASGASRYAPIFGLRSHLVSNIGQKIGLKFDYILTYILLSDQIL